MDESRSYRRAVKRLAILTVCGCTFFGGPLQGFSGESTEFDTTSSQAKPVSAQRERSGTSDSLRPFLNGGWQGGLSANRPARSNPIPMTIDPAAKSLAELIRREAQVASEKNQFADSVEGEVNAIDELGGKDELTGMGVAGKTTGEKMGSIDPTPVSTVRELVPLPEQAMLQPPVKLRPVQEIVKFAESVFGVETSTATDVTAADCGEAAKAPTSHSDPPPLSDSETVVVTEPQSGEVAETMDSLLSLPESFEEQPQFERTRKAAAAQGFGMLAMDCLEPPTKQTETFETVSPMTATIHESRLRELARESLQTAVHRLSHDGTHSAKRSTIEALHHIVAMLDAREGSNRHAKCLAVALDAIRESSEFAGTDGAADHDALVRRVAVHKTAVLKHPSLEETSALQAVEAYLNVAHENLVAACESVVEASDALVLMGKIQRQMNEKSDTYAAAVALTYYRAAVSVDPHNAVAHRELGKTLYGQGLLEQAARSLARSVELQPTREHYRLLMQVAQQTGDLDTVKECETAINDPRLASPLPIRHLDAKSFAATYQPTANKSPAENSSNKAVSVRTSTSQSSVSEDRPKSTRSHFKSWLPKFRRE